MKELKPFGIAGHKMKDYEDASGHTYTTNDGQLISTPLIFNGNPYNKEVKEAKYILDVGCGVGRNAKWILENTNAFYVGVEPNPSMFEHIHHNIDVKYNDRVMLYQHFNEIPKDIKIDIVVSTFVFQHIGYMPDDETFNVYDISKEIRKYTTDNTIWLLIEHDGENDWIQKYFNDMNIRPSVYVRNQQLIPELTHRDSSVPNNQGHHLIIFKDNQNTLI